MIRPVRITHLRLGASTSTPIESYFLENPEFFLNPDHPSIHHNGDAALAKTPEGGIVEIAFTDSQKEKSSSIHIVYQF